MIVKVYYITNTIIKMNYFFGVDNKYFLSEIQIPLFQNNGLASNNIKLYNCKPVNNKWEIQELDNVKHNSQFHFLESSDNTNSEIYFLADPGDLIGYDKLSLKNFNRFTDTSPDFRANLRILLKGGGGFSSYQSDYPYAMTKKKGSILSPISAIANKDADKNFIFIKNIYEKPIFKKFNAYLVNIDTRKIEEVFEIKTNYTNIIELDKKFIKPEIFLFTKDYLGVPMYVSLRDKHVSFEHTHPPHEYILSNNKHKKIKDLKKDINEIIN